MQERALCHFARNLRESEVSALVDDLADGVALTHPREDVRLVALDPLGAEKHVVGNLARNAYYAVDVAAHLGVSRPLLDLRFRETQKESVGRLITDTKLAEVSRRLKDTRVAIGAIPDLCGFKNANALKNLFKKRYGMSMREYRNEHS